jgi:hypothetical protein
MLFFPSGISLMDASTQDMLGLFLSILHLYVGLEFMLHDGGQVKMAIAGCWTCLIMICWNNALKRRSFGASTSTAVQCWSLQQASFSGEFPLVIIMHDM